MTHTPGPWTIIPGIYDTNPLTASEFPHGPEIVAGSVHIASLNLHAEEDACLIAAAPELLAALKECDDFLSNYVGEAALNLQSRVKAATTKAEGNNDNR